LEDILSLIPVKGELTQEMYDIQKADVR
jgi:hypothetical protein